MFSGLELTLLLLGSAVLGVVAFRMMHLPPMLGYLAVGILIGPHALGLADNSPHSPTEALAHFGVLNLEAFGCEPLREGVGAAGAVLRYVRETADEHGISPRVRYRHRVVAADWSAAESLSTTARGVPFGA